MTTLGAVLIVYSLVLLLPWWTVVVWFPGAGMLFVLGLAGGPRVSYGQWVAVTDLGPPLLILFFGWWVTRVQVSAGGVEPSDPATAQPFGRPSVAPAVSLSDQWRKRRTRRWFWIIIGTGAALPWLT